MNYFDKALNETNIDKSTIGSTLRSRQIFVNSSFDKIHSKSMNNDNTYDEINENIKKCYNNLHYLKNTFKKSKISLIKSSITKNINNNNSYNIIDSISKKLDNSNININIKNPNNLNQIQNYSLKNSSSSSNIKENVQKNIMHLEYNSKKNNIIKYPIESSYHSFFVNKYRPISPSININTSSKNYINPTKNYLNNNNQLHNSSSSNEVYLSFLQSKIDKSQNKKNNNLFLQYQEKKNNIKKVKNENLISFTKEEDIDYKKKYEESLLQIETLKTSIKDYQNNNSKLKEKISSLTTQINSNENKNKNKEQEIINKYTNEKKKTDENYLKLKEENKKLIEEIQILLNDNKDLSKKNSILIHLIKAKDKIISNLQKIQNIKTDSDSSIFDSIDEKSQIYKKKSTKEYSLDKIKLEKKKKKIEEIKLTIPKFNNKGKIIEIPIKKYNYDQLLKENVENKMKINILNSKLEQYCIIQKKYDEIIQNDESRDDESCSKLFISTSSPLNTLINEMKTDEINNENCNFMNRFNINENNNNSKN